jgi:DNA-binding MarR family transcriptional regulator
VTQLRGLYNDVIRLEIELWDAVDRRLRERCGLSMGGFDVMQVVARTPSCRVHDIARQLSITVGGTSKAVDRIEAAGHVARRSHPGDRRSSIIELTEAGAQLLAEATAVVDEELELRIGTVLSARELEQFGALISRLRSTLRQQPPDRASSHAN